jgi:hypothetical protein
MGDGDDERLWTSPWWFPISYAMCVTVVFIIYAPLGVLSEGTDWGFVFLTPAGPAVGPFLWRLRLGASGASIGLRYEPWENLMIQQTPFGAFMHARDGTPGFRFGAYLPRFERNWQDGQIGDALRNWAPHLLQPADRVG